MSYGVHRVWWALCKVATFHSGPPIVGVGLAFY